MPAKRSPGAAAVGPGRGRIKGAVVLLPGLRRDRGISQAALADAMGSTQAEISRTERRSDLRVSTLVRYIDAMGGQLELHARFSKGKTKTYTLRLGGQK